MPKEFPLDEVLTVTTGCLVARRHMDAVYEILNYLTGDNLSTHQLPRAAEHCASALKEQHPDLFDLDVPEFNGDKNVIEWWLIEQEKLFGTHRTLVPISDWRSRNPIEELCDTIGSDKVYVVVTDA